MYHKGFTLIEVSMVLAISALLLSLALINLTRVQSNTYVDTSTESLLSDIKFQQIQAMNGRLNQSGNPTSYGIHFEENSYTLFEGEAFNPSDPVNFTVSLQGNVSFTSVAFPSQVIVFEHGSGEIIGFEQENNTIGIHDSNSGLYTQIQLNKLGVFTDIIQ